METPTVLLITQSSRFGGAETHLLELVRGLRAAGEVPVVALNSCTLRERLVRENFRCLPVTLHRLHPLGLMLARQRLRTWLVQHPTVTLLHAHTRLGALLGKALANDTGRAFLTTVHARFRTPPLLRGLNRWSSPTVAVSDDLRRMLTDELHRPAASVRVIPNGIDTDRFAPAAGQSPAADGGLRRVVFVSRMDKDCAAVAELLLEIAPRLRERYGEGIRLQLIGGGSRRRAIRRRAGRLCRETQKRSVRHGLRRRRPAPEGDWIEVPGAVEDVRDYLRGAAVFVGVSRAALEAAACGCPVLLAGNEGYGGRLTPGNFTRYAASNFCGRGEGTPEAERLLADLCALLDEPAAVRRALGTTLRGMVLRRFSGADMIRRTLRVYGEARQAGRTADGRSRVLLCGYYGYRNLGDEYLLRHLLELFRQRGIEPIVLYPRGKALDAAETVCRTAPLQVLRAIRRCDRVVFGGGSLLQDGTSGRSFRYYATLLALAERCGKEPILYASGVGPLHRRLHLAETVRLLRRASAVFLRDTMSVELLRGQGLPAEDLEQVADPALGEPPRRFWSGGKVGRPILLVAPGPPTTWTGRQGREALSDLARTLAFFCRRHRLTIVLAALFPEQDQPVCRRLQALLRKEGFSGSCRVRVLRSLREAGSAVCDAAFVLSSRLHLLLPAAGCGAPFLPLGVAPKLVAFTRAVFPEESQITVFSDRLEATYADRFRLSARLRDTVPALAALAREGDRRFLENLTKTADGKIGHPSPSTDPTHERNVTLP